MLHYMARGDSGRIVLEIDPVQKEQLYDAVIRDGLTLKDWFLRQATTYLQDRSTSFMIGEPAVPYATTPNRAAPPRRGQTSARRRKPA